MAVTTSHNPVWKDAMLFNFKDARWNVTNSGVEAISPDGENYPIDRHRLLEVDRDGFIPLYVCPIRMSRQLGIDIEAFAEGWTRAIKAHRLDPDRRILADSLREARANAEHWKRQRWNEANLVSYDLPLPMEAPELPAEEAPEPTGNGCSRPPREKIADRSRPRLITLGSFYNQSVGRIDAKSLH